LNRPQFDVRARVKQIKNKNEIGILVEIDEILLKSLTNFRRTCLFDVVSTSFRRRFDVVSMSL